MRVFPFLLCIALNAQDPAILKEMALGRSLAAEVRRSTTPVESQAIQDYVAQLGARVTAQLPDRGIPYTFSVVQMMSGSMHAPHVLPGGYIFVPLDLFAAANDEAEFAGMLTQAAARGSLLLVKGEGQPSVFFGTLSSVPIIPMSTFPRLKAAELQADAAAAPAMARAGFDPTALLRYIDRMQEDPKGTTGRTISTLPPREERIAALSAILRDLPQVATVSSDAFFAIQEQARALLARDTPPALQRRPTLKRPPLR
jgi:predicted Zn-dependent protease